jgi:hypothetical protein
MTDSGPRLEILLMLAGKIGQDDCRQRTVSSYGLLALLHA